MKKRYALFMLLCFYIGRNMLDIVSHKPSDDAGLVYLFDSKKSKVSVDAPNAEKPVTESVPGTTKNAKLDVDFVYVAPPHASADLLAMNSNPGASTVSLNNGGYSPGASEGHGPSAGAGGEGGNYYAAPTTHSLVGSSAAVSAGGNTEALNPMGSGSGNGGNYISPFDGGVVVNADEDPGGPVNPPVDNVPIDGGLTLIITAVLVAGSVSFKKKKTAGGSAKLAVA